MESNKPKTIEEYINLQEEEKREKLWCIYEIIKKAIPDTEERISWGMPTFWKGKNIIHFAAAKKHIGIYPGPEAIEAFSDILKNYSLDKGTIRIPYDNIDENIISELAKWCLKNNSK